MSDTNESVLGLPWIRLHWGYSGRYRPPRKKPFPMRPFGGNPSPIHNLREPRLLPFPDDGRRIEPIAGIYVNLHVDIDGNDPLDVVSGTLIALTAPRVLKRSAHFIGRVSTNKKTVAGRELEVEDFSFNWPITGQAIERLELKLTPTLPSTDAPRAEATFVAASGRRHGPFELSHYSRYFRELEVEVDREDGAIDPEPYNTHSHPDRPEDFPAYNLDLEAVYHRAGIGITRTKGGTSILDSSDAGPDRKWDYSELHDAMEDHWSAFANRPQWKMWIFLGEKAASDTLLGVMFDGHIDEPGGVDRQGAAVFTQCPALYDLLLPDNPPEAEALQRVLFHTLVHEPAHALNLAHPWQKIIPGDPDWYKWDEPTWFPVSNDPLALTWMNYPYRASRIAEGRWSGFNSTWFWERFEYRFDDQEHLFLRHAPEWFVKPGGEAWGENHGLAVQDSLDHRLELLVRSRKPIFDLGEPVTLEVRLKNISEETVTVADDIDLSGGLLEIAVTDPQGRRRPFLPFVHADHRLDTRTLEPGEAIYRPLPLVIGRLGSPFKEAGAYRIEACYHNLAGGTAAAVTQLYVRPPEQFDDLPAIHELFNARVGRVLYIGGSREMEDVNDKLDWVSGKLAKNHPAQFHFARARSQVFARPFKVVDTQAGKLKLLDPDPDQMVKGLEPVVNEPESAADTLGHIGYKQLIETYSDCAVQVRKKAAAKKALSDMAGMFKARKVIPPVVKEVEKKLKKLN